MDQRPKRRGPRNGTSKALMDWEFIQYNFPWGLILLQGSGFAVSEACQKSSLSTWLGGELSVMNVLRPPFIRHYVPRLLNDCHDN